MSRIAGLIAVALMGVIVSSDGENGDSAMDFAGFHDAVLVVAVLFAIAGVVSAVGVRNSADVSNVAVDALAHCHDRVTPPPARR